MNLEVARNIAIVIALALVVWLVPGGGEGAALVEQILSAIFIVMIVLILSRLYRQYRGEIFGLGDQWRFALYAALGVAVVTVAASSRLFDSGAGTLLWFALLGAASCTLYLVWQQYRSYG
ncbi:MAG: hypothetical protein M3401_12315 [Actinomycetota bacterium]|nr:hypothetical protein [Actinomycetota bacterium]